MAAKIALTEKDLSLLSDLLTYEQWAAKKCQMYGASCSDADVKALCKTMETNHNKNFSDLYKYL